MRASIIDVIRYNRKTIEKEKADKILREITYDLSVKLFGGMFASITDYDDVCEWGNDFIKLQPLVLYRKIKKKKVRK